MLYEFPTCYKAAEGPSAAPNGRRTLREKARRPCRRLNPKPAQRVEEEIRPQRRPVKIEFEQTCDTPRVIPVQGIAKNETCGTAHRTHRRKQRGGTFGAASYAAARPRQPQIAVALHTAGRELGLHAHRGIVIHRNDACVVPPDMHRPCAARCADANGRRSKTAAQPKEYG